ncbi:Nuclear pore complex protein Nup50 [Mactra antiquata]
MSKRGATTELTDRNWDAEEEPEEAGEFARATENAMKGRQIIRAKRKNPASESAESKSAFSGFGGFAFKPQQTSTPMFGAGSGSFFKTESKISSAEKLEAIKEKIEVVNEQDTAKRKGDDEDRTDEASPSKKQKAETNGSSSEQNGSNKNNYLSNLKALNISVLNWIKQHLDKNPYCILSPIFKDYEKHLSELEKNKEANGSESLKKEESVKPMETGKPEMPKTGLTFGMGVLNTDKSVPTMGGFSGFSFKPTTTTTESSSSTATTSGFSFAIGSSTQTASSSQGATGSTEDEEYVPPIVETIEHKEEGSLYSKKCKLFYQKSGAWAERGVGYIHLKKTDDVAQVLIRADTSLGNILLNIRLSESIPLSRQGKNNVSLMCVVNPAISGVPDDKPIPMMIRVKTAEDADELLEKMKETRS